MADENCTIINLDLNLVRLASYMYSETFSDADIAAGKPSSTSHGCTCGYGLSIHILCAVVCSQGAVKWYKCCAETIRIPQK